MASLGTAGPAVASCINISGIAIGGGGPTGHCQASFGSFSIVIGPTPVDAEGAPLPGSSAKAGGNSFSPLNFAIALGGTETQSTEAAAGRTAVGSLPSIANVAFATAGSTAASSGLLNLAASLGGTRSIVSAAGIANSALNLGSDNTLDSSGVVNNTTNAFGNNNTIASSNTPGGFLGLRPGLNVAFSLFGSNNDVSAGASAPPNDGNGPLSIAGAIFVDGQEGPSQVKNTNFGIELRTPFNVQTPNIALAAAKKVAGSVNPTGSKLSVSPTKAAKHVSLKSVQKKFNNAVKAALGGAREEEAKQ